MRRLASLLVALACTFLLCACGGSDSDVAASQASAVGHLQLDYATQFDVEYREDGTSMLTIGGTERYYLVPKAQTKAQATNDAAPPTATEGDATVIALPIENTYLAASSSMDFFRQLDALGCVRFTSTKAQDWSLPEVVAALNEDSMTYVGKYSAPDYELVLSQGADVAIESTMIYHAPDVAERLEALGIPVLVERSSYETSPLARLEWIKLYGLLTGRLDEAEEFFARQVELLEKTTQNMKSEHGKDVPTVAFFSIGPNGRVVVRKPGDYVSQMIELAGGTYFLGTETPQYASALSTMNMEMESFYEAAHDADVIIYNSAIDATLESVDELVAKNPRLADFAAVRENNVWCTGKDLFQQPTCAAQLIEEMNAVFCDKTKDDSSFIHLYHVGAEAPGE